MKSCTIEAIEEIDKDAVVLVMTLPRGLTQKAIEIFMEQAKEISDATNGIPVIVLREGVTLKSVKVRELLKMTEDD